MQHNSCSFLNKILPLETMLCLVLESTREEHACVLMLLLVPLLLPVLLLLMPCASHATNRLNELMAKVLADVAVPTASEGAETEPKAKKQE